MESSEGQPGDRNARGASFSEKEIPHMDAVYRFALRLSGSGDEAEEPRAAHLPSRLPGMGAIRTGNPLQELVIYHL